MIGVRFYLDHDSPADKRRGKHNGNVVAVSIDAWRYGGKFFAPWVQTPRSGRVYDCVSALFSEPDSPVSSCGVHSVYLETCCKRISEKQAREIHPRLFEYLEAAS